MGTDSNPPVRRRWRIPRWVLIALIILLAVGVFIASVHLYYYLRIKSEHAAIVKAGFPTTLMEADAQYVVPPTGENAADYILPAFARHVVPPMDAPIPFLGGGSIPARGQRITGETLTVSAKYLADNAAELADLHQASSMTKCRYPLNLMAGPAVSVAHLQPLKTAARILCLEALLRAQGGEAPQMNGGQALHTDGGQALHTDGGQADAMESVRASLAMAHTLAQEPIELSQFIRNTIDRTSVQTLERVLSLGPAPEAKLEELAAEIRSEEEGRSEVGVRIFAKERCIGMEIFDDAARLDAVKNYRNLQDDVELEFAKVIGYIESDHLDYLRKMRELIAAYGKPFPERLEATRAVEQSVRELSSFREITQELFPSATRYGKEEATAVAQLAAARTGLAVERYRLREGRLPAKLSDMVPQYIDAVPIDPSDGKPMRYRELTKGFVVYSVGPNCKDDGGKEWQAGTSFDSDYDLTFIVER